MFVRALLEGVGLGALLVLVCAVGIRRGAVGMVHLYSPAVQDRCVQTGLTTRERISKNAARFKLAACEGGPRRGHGVYLVLSGRRPGGGI